MPVHHCAIASRTEGGGEKIQVFDFIDTGISGWGSCKVIGKEWETPSA